MKFLLAIITFTILFTSCESNDQLFRNISSSESGISFNNEIIDNNNLNILDYEYLYNGGGVGVGDFNNDGLPDIYFSANRVSNKLYINKGNLKFEDVTETSNTGTNGIWSKGVSVVDINNDGLLDIYVSTSVLRDTSLRKNLLYINKGVKKNTNIPEFVESAGAYGLADTSSTQMAAFFDYDNDGDLDIYLLVNELDQSYPNQFRPIRKDGSALNTDRLLRNDWDEKLQHPVFTNVSKEAGITWEGHGLGLNIVDINQDGWKDIYVSNDYISNNLLYINDHGKFTNKCADYFKHTSRNAMGNDMADLNNDGLQDLIELDMMPEDNYRKKMMNNPIKYQTFLNSDQYGYMHQYVRNTLQVNEGARRLSNDSIGDPVFSEIAYFSGIAETDWSWSVLAVDVDNDDYRDILVSNGLPKDLTDMDFMSFRNKPVAATSKAELLKQLPVAKVSNYIFRNNGDLTFTNKTKDWGWNIPSFATGMAYADFDNDGDVDVIINNTNMPATLLENTLNQKSSGLQNFVRIKLIGDSSNLNGIGSMIHIYYKNKSQVYENTPYRGYLSTVESVAHFGVGAASRIDSVVVFWPNGTVQVEKNLEVNQTISVSFKPGNVMRYQPLLKEFTNNWFTDVTTEVKMNFIHNEKDDIDFNIQRLIPRKLSQFGPSIAVGDINSDGMDDLVVGGDEPYGASLFFQDANGFRQQQFIPGNEVQLSDDMGICLFDADGDRDLDLYVTSGGVKPFANQTVYNDRLFINDGTGNFKPAVSGLPDNLTSKCCVKAADYDNDGDLDLFIGGRVQPGNYPKPVSSFIYKNESKEGNIRFTDVTMAVAPSLKNIGMVTDAVWTDANNDGQIDLIITGEWMAVTCFKNDNGKLEQVKTNLSDEPGWWNSITGSDIDNDGDIDYVVGNYGQNGFLKASAKNPVRIYAKDFDNNSIFDAIVTAYIPTSPHGPLKEYPVAGRDELIEQMAPIKGKYPNYASYSNADLEDLLVDEDKEDAIKLSASNFNTGWIENIGNFSFLFHPLPGRAQWSPVFGIVTNDFNDDGNIDLLLNGNEFSMSPGLGRNDAFNGLLLKGDGKGNFSPLSILESGIYIPGNGKGAVQMRLKSKLAIVVSQNRGPVKIFQTRLAITTVPLLPDDKYAMIEYKDGKTRREEFYYGTSFLSQSGRYVTITPGIKQITIINNKGLKRILK